MKRTIATIALALMLTACAKQQPQPEKFGYELAKSWTPQEASQQIKHVSLRMRIDAIGASEISKLEHASTALGFSECVLQAEIDRSLEENPSLPGSHSGPKFEAKCDADIKAVLGKIKADDNDTAAQIRK